jgi:hypothetical protein
MDAVFDIVYRFLVFISELTHLSYHEINIIVYYIIAPFVYFFLLDKIFHFHYLKIGFAVFVILFLIFIPDFAAFSTNAFISSQHFLQGFGFLGLNYVGASVVICVVLPFLVFSGLFWVAYKDKIKRRIKK